MEDERASLFLRSDEKEAMKMHLLSYMQAHPLSVDPEDPKEPNPSEGWFLAWVKGLPVHRLTYAPILSALAIVFLGAGVAFASQNSLPGEALYPVKVGVNERVLEWMTPSPEAKAQLHIDLANKRLQEVEKVTLKGKLNASARSQAEHALTLDVEQAQKRIQEVQKDEETVSLNSQLESVLRAHTKIIADISTEGEQKEVAAFTKQLDTKHTQVKKERQKSEQNTVKKDGAQIQALATTELALAEKRLQEVSGYVAKHKSQFSQESYEKAIKNLLAAGNLLMNGKSNLESGNYESALLFLRQGQRTLNEIDVNVETHVELKANIRLNDADISDDETDAAGLIIR